MSLGAPQVSVVVPVRDRRVLLGDLLDALDHQTYRDFEVVVVDDGSTDGSGELAASRVVASRPVRVVTERGQGAIGARSRGVAEAAGDVLAFTDSDCRPAPNWLGAAMAAIESGADVVHGRTRPERPVAPLERSVWAEDDALYPTCNVFYRRAVFDKLGGFDATASSRWGFRVDARAQGLGFGEDTLLAWRAHRAGCRVEFVPDAFVAHHVFPPDIKEAVSRTWMMAAFPGLVREVPELRSTLVRHRVLWGPRTRVPAYVTLLMLLGRRRWLGTAALVWWAVVRARDLRGRPGSRGRRLAALPQEMLLDLVTGAALATGSVRHRLLLL